jgi:CO/xanthine dehydrogenase FAD-binding subunit
MVAALHYEYSAENFFRPVSLAELFTLRRTFPDARLIAGATEIGVEINKKFSHFPRLISTEAVVELREIHSTPEHWHLGAAATLTQIEEALGGEFPSLDRMLTLFASRQIRNRATLGGNLATASPIGDSAPVLLALDATLVLASEMGERRLPLAAFFTGYRQTALRPDEIIKSIILPRIAGRRAEFFKVSKRREMDISIASAAFCVATDARAWSPTRGSHSAASPRCLRGPGRRRKPRSARPWMNLSRGVRSFARDVPADRRPARKRGLSARIDRQSVGRNLRVAKPRTFPKISFRVRCGPVDSASRMLSHESAIGHVTGRAQYVDDVAQQRPMLDCWPVCAPHARARILSRDVREALKYPVSGRCCWPRMCPATTTSASVGKTRFARR